MTRMRILVLMHPDFMPPASIEGLSEPEYAPFKTEFDVVATLRDMGHEVIPLGVTNDLGVIERAVREHKPHIAFNLLEELAGVGVFDSHVVAYLESIRLPYTGCNPRGLMLAHNKAVSKILCKHHRVPAPRFHVFPQGQRTVRRPPRLGFPLIVKSLTEEGSIGIAEASVVDNDEKLEQRVRFIHEKVGTDAIAEQYLEGRELYIGVLGNLRLTTLPVWEMHWPNLRPGAPKIATTKVKWDLAYQKKIGLETRPAEDLPDELENLLVRYSKRVYKALQLSGYARLDFRLTEEGKPYLLEANPNPQLAYGEDFAESAHAAGMDYEPLLRRILSLGQRYRLVGQA
ncbi:MAG: D-alanine--D-alanine ligase [Planctomycetota bacterium]